jgi:hypothetical protein
MSERYTEEQYAEAFRRKLQRHAFTRDDHLDVDPPVTIADSGAHVQVWLWISDDEVEAMGFKPEPEEEEDEGVYSYECEECGEMRDTGDTKCPHCGEVDDDTEEAFEEASRLTDSAMADAEEE